MKTEWLIPLSRTRMATGPCVQRISNTVSHAKSRPHFITGITLWVAASAVLAQLPRTAPLSPEFAAYAAKAKAGQLQTTADGKHGLGGCPSPVDMSYLSGQIIQPAKIGPLALATSYDLRTTGRMTAVKNQGTYGTCWAHATMGVLESCLMPAENQDFSENNLVNLAGFDWGFNYGGNAKMAMAYLARWGGPVRESDDPYPNPGGSASGLTVRKHVQQTRIIPPRTGATGNDAIKQAIMDYGALLVNYCHSDTCYNSTNKSYYYSGTSGSNHYVVIAGWDDNYAKTKFSTAPAGNGAYIVRNSWGANWGENGYFYVSYYDTKFAYGDIYAFSNVEPTSNYSRIYSYDPLGWIGNFGTGTTPTYWAANMFTSTANENLGAVGFYATGANASYAIYIYTGVTAGSPRSGTLAATQTGTCQYPGYYTINLTTPATLTTNGRFSIVLQMTTPGNNYPQAIEKVVSGYSSAATAAAGQSYYSCLLYTSDAADE